MLVQTTNTTSHQNTLYKKLKNILYERLHEFFAYSRTNTIYFQIYIEYAMLDMAKKNNHCNALMELSVSVVYS